MEDLETNVVVENTIDEDKVLYSFPFKYFHLLVYAFKNYYFNIYLKKVHNNNDNNKIKSNLIEDYKKEEFIENVEEIQEAPALALVSSSPSSLSSSSSSSSFNLLKSKYNYKKKKKSRYCDINDKLNFVKFNEKRKCTNRSYNNRYYNDYLKNDNFSKYLSYKNNKKNSNLKKSSNLFISEEQPEQGQEDFLEYSEQDIIKLIYYFMENFIFKKKKENRQMNGKQLGDRTNEYVDMYTKKSYSDKNVKRKKEGKINIKVKNISQMNVINKNVELAILGRDSLSLSLPEEVKGENDQVIIKEIDEKGKRDDKIGTVLNDENVKRNLLNGLLVCNEEDNEEVINKEVLLLKENNINDIMKKDVYKTNMSNDNKLNMENIENDINLTSICYKEKNSSEPSDVTHINIEYEGKGIPNNGDTIDENIIDDEKENKIIKDEKEYMEIGNNDDIINDCKKNMNKEISMKLGMKGCVEESNNISEAVNEEEKLKILQIIDNYLQKK